MCGLPSPFHLFGLLVLVVGALNLTWYQSHEALVPSLGFRNLLKNCCAILPVAALASSLSTYRPLESYVRSLFLYAHVVLLSHILEVGGGVKVCVDCPFHQYGLLVVLPSA